MFKTRNPLMMVILLVVLPVLLAFTLVHNEMTSSNFKIPWDALDEAGCLGESGSFKMEDSVGQSSAIGTSESVSYKIYAGFQTPFPPCSPWIAIWLEPAQTVFHKGDPMRVKVRLVNPCEEEVGVRVQIGLKLPNNNIWPPSLINKWVTLPAGFDKTYTIFDRESLPLIPEGDYCWHARLKNSDGDIISQDEACWSFEGTGGSMANLNQLVPKLDYAVSRKYRYIKSPQK